MTNPNIGPNPMAACTEIDAGPRHLAHNMSSPPKSVVNFEGLNSMAGHRHPLGLDYIDRVLFGTPIHFALLDEWRRLRTPGFLRLIDKGSKRRSPAAGEARLHQLIEQRAKTLPLPEGCVTIPGSISHPVLWSDALSVLTILTKCTTTVWLRHKTPSLLAALEQRSISLLVPPAFAHRLPAISAPQTGEDHGN